MSGGRVDLRAIYLNEARSPQDMIRLELLGDSYSVDPTLAGGVETGYASGRSRSWSAAGDVATVEVTVRGVTPAQQRWLRDHRGRTLCFRDPTGEKFFVVYHKAPVTYSTLADDPEDRDDQLKLSLTQVTYSEAV